MRRVDELLQKKRIEVQQRKAANHTLLRDFPSDDRRVEWDRRLFHLIAEIKRASLSEGDIRAALDPVAVAIDYQRAGASAISVLTEQNYFSGSLNDLRSVCNAVVLPVLQKDFILDEFQIAEAKAAGANFVLLIARFVTQDQLRHLFEFAERRLRLNALVEVADENDLAKIPAGARYVGVNARNLETLQMDSGNFSRLRKKLPEAFLIAESGISDLEALADVIDEGYNGALIGSHFLRASNPADELKKFVEFARKWNSQSSTRVKVCGISSLTDAQMAVEAGASALGFIFVESPRQITVDELNRWREQLPRHALRVGVFRGQNSGEVSQIMSHCRLDIAQVYDSTEIDRPLWQAKTITDLLQIEKTRSTPDQRKVLWDVKAHEQSIQMIWKELGTQSVFALAGSLTPENVGEAVQMCRPRWVDVARGVEREPAVKDWDKMKRFVKAVAGLKE